MPVFENARDLDNRLTPKEPLHHKMPPLLCLYNRPQKHSLPRQYRKGINRKPRSQIPPPNLPSAPHDLSIARPMFGEKVQEDVHEIPHIREKNEPVPFIGGSISNINMSNIGRHKRKYNRGNIPQNLETMIGRNYNDAGFGFPFSTVGFMNLLEFDQGFDIGIPQGRSRLS